MRTLDKALGLAKLGCYVFPVQHDEKENTKKPLTEKGHLDATTDPKIIRSWWRENPDAKIGVFAGKSGLNILDVDTKNGKDGWSSLEENWYIPSETFSYETGTGGTHLVYLAPEGIELSGVSNYRGLKGVDRRAGSSWAMWVGGVPTGRDEFQPAPEWLNDEKASRTTQQFEGRISEWFEKLPPGKVNALTRKALTRATERFESQGNDYSHSDVVELQYEAVRLGAEGNPGVPDLLEHVYTLFKNRTDGHSRPESEWDYEWTEALESAIEQYGAPTDNFSNLVPYSIGLVPEGIPDQWVTTPGGKAEFSKLLASLVTKTEDDNLIASILWGAPATIELSREWGLEFVHLRIKEARLKPEPVKENPALEEERDLGSEHAEVSLLTPEEREYIAKRPSFADHVEEVAREMGYNQLKYFRSVAWIMASTAFGFKGFIPVSASHRHGLNLWNITIGLSGTGKSTVIGFRDQVLNLIFEGDNPEGAPYSIGADSSPQGLHQDLLERDNLPSLFSADEASGFFKSLSKNDWNSGLEDSLSAWYNGYVSPSSKIRLKELRGKSAKTSFSSQMFATPDRLLSTLNREQFKSGHLARYTWTIGDPPQESKDRFKIFRDPGEEAEDVTEEVAPRVVQLVATDLLTAVSHLTRPVALRPTMEAAERLESAYERMFGVARARKNWDITEPAVTRLMEAMLKVSGICALYRSDDRILLEDALHGIAATEEWLGNLFIVAEEISEGTFQKNLKEIQEWISGRKGRRASRAQIFHAFRGMIERDSRELDSYLTYLVESGVVVRDESTGPVNYIMNGG